MHTRTKTLLAVTTAVALMTTAACGTNNAAKKAGNGGGASKDCSIAKDLDAVKGMSDSARTAKLKQLASKEGKSIQVYNTLSDDEMNAAAAEFKKLYGVSIKVYDANSEELLQRLNTEEQAGKTQADLMENDGTELQLAAAQGLLAPVTSTYAAGLPKQVVFPTWVGHLYNVFTVLRNPTVISTADAPKTYKDLADPKYQGKIGIESGNWDLYATTVQYMEKQNGLSESQAEAVWKKIASSAKIYNSNTQLAEAVNSGELGLGITYNHDYTRYASKGSKTIAWQPAIEPQVLRPNGAGIPCSAPHPATALLLFDFMISKHGQEIVGDVGNRDVTNPTVKTGLLRDTNVPKVYVDLTHVVDESKKWVDSYNKLVRKGGN